MSYDDIPSIVTYAGNKNVADNTLNIPHPYTKRDAIIWIDNAIRGFERKSQYTFAIRLIQDENLIGAIGLRSSNEEHTMELGYWIGEPYWNKGYATEAAVAIVSFGFNQLKLKRIYAAHLIENPASGKVMQNIGMMKGGIISKYIMHKDIHVRLMEYRIDSTDL